MWLHTLLLSPVMQDQKINIILCTIILIFLNKMRTCSMEPMNWLTSKGALICVNIRTATFSFYSSEVSIKYKLHIHICSENATRILCMCSNQTIEITIMNQLVRKMINHCANMCHIIKIIMSNP